MYKYILNPLISWLMILYDDQWHEKRCMSRENFSLIQHGWRFNLNYGFEVIRKHFALTILVSWVMTLSFSHSMTGKSNAACTRPSEIIISLNFMHCISYKYSLRFFFSLQTHTRVWRDHKVVSISMSYASNFSMSGKRVLDISNYQNWMEHVLVAYPNNLTRHLHLKK
jgi:hypothetical protein